MSLTSDVRPSRLILLGVVVFTMSVSSQPRFTDANSRAVLRERAATAAETIVRLDKRAGKERFEFNLFHKVAFVGIVEREGEPSHDSRSWSGSLEKTPGTFTLVEYHDSRFLNIHTANRVYEVVPSGEPGGVTVTEINPARLLECITGQHTSEDAEMPPAPCAQAETDVPADGSLALCKTDPIGEKSEIDILFVYPTLTLSAAGRETLKGRLLVIVDETNQAFLKSKVNATVRIAKKTGAPEVSCIVELNYLSMGEVARDLERLIKRGDTFMDDVHTLRTLCHADVGILLLRTADAGGMSCTMRSLSTAYEPYAFAVVEAYSAFAGYSVTHELGHMMGAGHDAANFFQGMCRDSKGWIFTDAGRSFKTVMAKGGDSRRVLHFSDPCIGFGGEDGPPTGRRSEANNARTLRLSAETVSKFEQ